mgnify:CR=1 FL=1
MDNFVIGTIIKSIAGHDQNNFFVILNVENEYVYLVDGKTRTLNKPKKKKLKHIQVVGKVSETFVELLNNNRLLDSHIRTIIRNELKNIIE